MASDGMIVSLLDADPELGERLSPGARDEARRLMRVRVVELTPGGLPGGAAPSSGRGPYGLMLLLDGLVSRSVQLGDSVAVQLLGPGDVLETATAPRGGELVPTTIAWAIVEPGRAAILDEELLHGALRWPTLVAALFERISAQSLTLASRCAISQMPRVEDRIEMLLWHLAERFGRVAVGGVVVPLRLTHEALGQLIGARRSTVSLALKQLEADRLVRRRADGAWLLRPPEEELPKLVERRGGGVHWIEQVELLSSELPGLEQRRTAGADQRAVLAETARIEQDRLAADQMTARIERMRSVHERTRVRVSSTLSAASDARDRSADLRARVQRERTPA